jgi:hypothetical protein
MSVVMLAWSMPYAHGELQFVYFSIEHPGLILNLDQK